METALKVFGLATKIATFSLGVYIVIHEVGIADNAEPQNLGIAALCLGLVAGDTIDKLRNKDKGSGK